jgi:SHS2 domain-containing protein
MRYTLGVKRRRYEEIEHTADWALRIHGKNMADLLVNAAQGMLTLMGIEPQDEPGEKCKIHLEAYDREMLLVIWLEELLYAMETREVTFLDISIDVSPENRLMAEVIEIPYKGIDKHIKAVTYSDLHIDETSEGLVTKVVFDV